MTTETLLERKAKRTDYMADYYQANKAKKKAYEANYYLENREVINARNKAWYEEHKNQPSKRNYYRQKDVLKVLSSQRKEIGEASYHLLVTEIKKLDKEVFKA